MAQQGTTTQPPVILSIEDDTLVRQSIVSYLNAYGYRMLQAADGKEGVEIFKREHPDLVLTDLRLPEMDGIEVLATISEESPDTPVIICSGMGTMDDVIRALKLGACDYVTKPVTDMALIEHAVEKALERSRLIRENRQHQEFLEEEILKKTAELYQAQKLEAIGTLAGGIAHDFNNILAAIMGFTELALLKIDKENPVAGDLEQIKKASGRAKKLVLQILTFSRKGGSTRQPVQAALLIKEALKLLRATLPATVEIKQDIQAAEEMILADPTELHQVITNLCTNAFQALEDEKGVISITLDNHTLLEKESRETKLPLNSQWLRLRVSDTGVGMSRDTRHNIFNPFFTTKDPGQGTGLGLSVVHGIVTDCNGRIQVESEPGRGTTFTLLFPLVQDGVNEQDDAVVVPPGGKERILFVDDEENLRILTGRMLTWLGYEVVCSASGREALAELAGDGSGFDLVITDQSMPEIPGTELARRIDKLIPGMPVLLCTGYSSMVDEKKALNLGIRGFLQKPVSLNSLALEVRRILDIGGSVKKISSLK